MTTVLSILPNPADRVSDAVAFGYGWWFAYFGCAGEDTAM